MRAVPRQVRALDEAWLQSDHIAVIIIGATLGPLPVVPLPDKTAPILNVQFNVLAANVEGTFLIAISGGR